MSFIINNPALCIAAGILGLLGSQLLPGIPVVGAVALIATGAIAETHRRWPDAMVMLAMQLLVYSSLVMLFLGARLHSATVTGNSLGIIDLIDFSVASVLMFFLFRSAIVLNLRAFRLH